MVQYADPRKGWVTVPQRFTPRQAEARARRFPTPEMRYTTARVVSVDTGKVMRVYQWRDDIPAMHIN